MRVMMMQQLLPEDAKYAMSVLGMIYQLVAVAQGAGFLVLDALEYERLRVG